MSFPTTQWNLIAAATLNGDRAGRDALNELCRLYREPVLAFFRSKMARPEDAQDLTQRLFERLCEGRIWKRADASKGLFRSYLLAIAFNVLRNWNKAVATSKRGPGTALLSLDFLDENGWEPAAPDDDTAITFDREWALAALAAAWDRMEESAAARPEKSARFAILRRFLPGKDPPPTYEAAADSLGVSVDHLKTLIHRIRSKFRKYLRVEVARTVSSPDELESEMDHLHSVMIAGIGGGANRDADIL